MRSLGYSTRTVRRLPTQHSLSRGFFFLSETRIYPTTFLHPMKTKTRNDSRLARLRFVATIPRRKVRNSSSSSSSKPPHRLDSRIPPMQQQPPPEHRIIVRRLTTLASRRRPTIPVRPPPGTTRTHRVCIRTTRTRHWTRTADTVLRYK